MEYGILNKKTNVRAEDVFLEELKINGYSVVPDVLDNSMLELMRSKLNQVYQSQENSFEKRRLEKIYEINTARCLLAYDELFVQLAANEKILSLLENILGSVFILNQQNGILNSPNEIHHQTSWHRDLPYQDWVISKPLAISVLYCIDDFTSKTGGTYVLPHTHKIEYFPSLEYVEKHEKQLTAKAGSVIMMDSMIYHRAGHNTSTQIRRAVNHVYSIPLLKQQIDIPGMLKGRFSDDPKLSPLLGYPFRTPESVEAWRELQYKKKNE